MPVAADITRLTIRDGDPAALAALCERRGAAVLAYCEQVAARGQAANAAADAFARLRVAVVSPEEGPRLQADALLLHLVRRAAVTRAFDASGERDENHISETCPAQQFELVAYVEDSLPPPDRAAIEDHLVRCVGCSTSVRRLQAGERAFQRPPRAPLPVGVAEELLAALLSVAPVRACGGSAAAVQQEALRLLAGERPSTSARAPAEKPPGDRSARPPNARPARAGAPARADQPVRRPAVDAAGSHAPAQRGLDWAPLRRPKPSTSAAPAAPAADATPLRAPPAMAPVPPPAPAAPALPPATLAPDRPPATPAPDSPAAAATPSGPAARAAPRRLATRDARAAIGRVRAARPPLAPGAALLTAAAVLGSAAVLWLSSSSGTTLLPTPSPPVSLGGSGDVSSSGGATGSGSSARPQSDPAAAGP